jgi:hypothetical protein
LTCIKGSSPGVDANGDESFGLLTPLPKTEGIYGTDATVADCLDQQGVAPLLEMGGWERSITTRSMCRKASIPTNSTVVPSGETSKKRPQRGGSCTEAIVFL